MSYVIPSCLDGVVGLSSTDCACFDDKPTGYNDSESGLYIADAAPLSSLIGAENCERGDVWDILEKARSRGITKTVADISALLLKNNRLKRPVFKGMVGDVRTSRQLNPLTTYAGVRVFCADIISGVWKITGIGGIFSQSGVQTIDVYNNLNEHLYSIDVTTLANKHNMNVLASPIELPLHRDEVANVEYYFIYTVGASKPLNNQVKCQCGSCKFMFNTKRPYFHDCDDQRWFWSKYAMFGGYTTNSVADFQNIDCSSSNDLYGLTFQSEFKCKIQETICKDTLDFDSNPLANTLAMAIQDISAVYALESIITSDVLNWQTIINREAVQATIAQLTNEYNVYVGYIVDNIDLTVNDCMICKDFIDIMKTGVFS